MAHAYYRLGMMDEFDSEVLISERLMDGIELTGDGSKERPFLVTRISDEFDNIRIHKLNMASQILIDIDDRECDVIETRENTTVWFDITEIKKILDNKLLIE